MDEDRVNVRYMVDDVETAVDFYTTHLGFTVLSSAAPAFADIVRGNLRLLLPGPASSAGRPMPDSRQPAQAAGTEFISSSRTLAPRSSGFDRPAMSFRNDIVTGPGGSQILLDDPSGNPIELFQPVRT